MTDEACSQVRRDLADALRGRLSKSAERALSEHLVGCAECRAIEQRERALDTALRDLPTRPASEDLKARLLASVEPERKQAGFSRRTALGGGVALALSVCLALGAWRWKRISDADALIHEAVNDHLRVLYDQQPVEIANGGIHQVKPWFAGRLDFAPALDFSGDAEFELSGGAVGYFVDRKAAVFVFKHRLHVMTLFVFRAEGFTWPDSNDTPLGRLNGNFTRTRGFGTLLYRDGDLGYAVVSDASDTTILHLGEKLVHRE